MDCAVCVLFGAEPTLAERLGPRHAGPMTTDTQTWTVGQFMTERPCTVAHDLSLADASDRMEANNIRHLLVTWGNNLVGVLSSRDITFALSLPGTKVKSLEIGEFMSQKVYVCPVDAPLQAVCRGDGKAPLRLCGRSTGRIHRGDLYDDRRLARSSVCDCR